MPQIPKAHMNKHVRTQIAQLLTIQRERQIADGIDRKMARKIEKRAAFSSGIGTTGL